MMAQPRSCFIQSEQWLLAGLFLLALLPRAIWPNLMEFKHDEAVAWLRATALMRGMEFPMTGLISSKGLENFPFFLYLMAVFRFFLTQPTALIGPIALLNSLAVYYIYYATGALLNERTAWLTVILYIVSPGAVFFSRKLWAQDLLPFWSCAMFGLAAMLITRRSGKHEPAMLAAFSFLAMTSWQLHFSAVFLFLAYLITLGLNRTIFIKKSALAGAIAGLVPTLPYAVYQFHTHFAGIRALRSQAAIFHRFRLAELGKYFIRQVADEGFPLMLGADYPAFVRSLAGYNMLRYGLSLLVLLGFILLIFRMIRGDSGERKNHGLILCLMLVPIILLGAIRTPLVPSYFIIFYPLPFLLAALALDHAWTWLQARLPHALVTMAVVLLLIVISGYQCACTATFLKRLKTQSGTRGDYGATYRAQVESIHHRLANQQSPGVEYTDGLEELAIFISQQLHPLQAVALGLSSSSTPASPSSTNPTQLTAFQQTEAQHAHELAQRLLAAH